jgi:hypothetical protein
MSNRTVVLVHGAFAESSSFDPIFRVVRPSANADTEQFSVPTRV